MIHRQIHLQRDRSKSGCCITLGFFIFIIALSVPKTAVTAETYRSGSNAVETIPAMPPVIDPNNLYSETQAGKLSPSVKGALPRVYVPNRQSNDVTVIDSTTLKVVDRFSVGINPQHVVPSWDLKTLWVANNAEHRIEGSLTPIDPITAKPGKNVPVDDPYNMYFTPDGHSAVVVAEQLKRLDFRDPQTMKLQSSLDVPGLRRDQSCRFFHRWPFRDLYLRVPRQTRED